MKWLTLDSKSLQLSTGTMFGRGEGGEVYLYFVLLPTVTETFLRGGLDVSGATGISIFVFLRADSYGKAIEIFRFGPCDLNIYVCKMYLSCSDYCCTCNVNIKVGLQQAMKVQSGSRGIVLLFL